MSSALSNDKPIRKIAFTYELSLPARWVIGIQQFKRKLVRAGLRVPVICVPVNILPADVDVVFAPATLSQQVQERAPTAEVIPLASFVNQPCYSTLLNRLRSAQAIQPEHHTSQKPIIVTYRGEERIG